MAANLAGELDTAAQMMTEAAELIQDGGLGDPAIGGEGGNDY